MAQKSDTSPSRREILLTATSVGIASLLPVSPSGSPERYVPIGAAAAADNRRSGRLTTKDGADQRLGDRTSDRVQPWVAA